MTWKTQPLQPERFRTADSTRSVRLILRNGETLAVTSPVIVRDSLIGMETRWGGGTRPDSLVQIGVPLAEVSKLRRAVDKLGQDRPKCVQREHIVESMSPSEIGVELA